MNSLQVATQLKALSADKDNQVHIAREEGCLNGLVDFVLNDDPAVAMAALEGLHNLSSHPQNKTLLLEHGCLLTNVKAAFSKWESNSEVRTWAQSTLQHLNVTLPVLRKSHGHFNPASPSVDRRTRSAILQVDDLHLGNVKHTFELVMVDTKGVISFTLVRTQAIVLFRGDMLTSQGICEALAKKNITACVESEDNGVSSPDKENANPQTHTPSYAASKTGSPKYATPRDKYVGRQAVVTTENNSLKARLEAQRNRRKKKEARITSLFAKFSLW